MIGTVDPSHLTGVAAALGLGMLVGLQRAWTLRDRAPGTRFAGIRTFGLIGLAGGIAGAVYLHAAGPANILLAAAAGLILAGYLRSSRIDGLADGTSGFAALVTLACGFLSGNGEHMLGTTIAVVMLALLAMREQLHGWISRLTETELQAIARFAVIALVILPLLPDAPFGPYGAWNPRKLWLVVVLVSGFSFAGYFAAKLPGPSRGILATAAAGSMVSSTAVTAALARRVKTEGGNTPIMAAAVSLAQAVMILRVAVLTGLLAPFALQSLAVLTAAGLVISIAACVWFLRAGARSSAPARGDGVDLRNPFDLVPALMLTGLVMAMTVAARWVLERFGDQGLAVVLAISGTVDVDSAIITLGGLPEGSLHRTVAGAVLAAPVALNTLFKAGVALTIGGRSPGWTCAWPLIASALAIAASYAFTFIP